MPTTAPPRTIEELPSGRLALGGVPLVAGEPIALRIGNNVVDCVVTHDGYEWYGRADDGEYALMPGREAWRQARYRRV